MSTEPCLDQIASEADEASVARPAAETPSTVQDVIRRLADLSPDRRALFIARLQKGGVEESGGRVAPRPARSNHLPLSFAQQRLYFLYTYDPGDPAYNMPSALRLRGRLDCAALERSIGEIIRRHEALRTTFPIVEGQPTQYVSPPSGFELPRTDLTRFPREERETDARRLASAEAQTPFDLGRGPLFRARLLRLDEQDHVLLLNMHHIISDGESVGILTGELVALYRAFTRQQPSPLPELAIQYPDFARWQREQCRIELMSKQLPYWKQHLEGSSPLIDLPTDRPRSAVRTRGGATEHVEIPPALADALRRFSRDEQATLFMTLLAVYKVLLYRLSAQEDLTVGSVIAGRQQPETAGLIGFFINTLALRTRLAADLTFREVLGRVREVVLGAFAHQDLPFEKIVEELKPERDASYSPLFQVMFSLHVMPPATAELPGLTLSALDYEFGTSKFDMSLNLCETPEGISGYCEYNRDLFDAETIRRMLVHYQTILTEVVAEPDLPIINLQLLSREPSAAGQEAGGVDAIEEFDFLC